MSAIDSAINSLKLERRKLEVASHNIANAETSNYSKINVVQESVMSAGNLQGAEIATLRAETDEFLENDLLNEISSLSYYETKKYYYEQIDAGFGRPGSLNGIDAQISEMFNQIRTLAAETNNVSQKIIAVQELNATAEKISELARKLENLRFDADHKLNLQSATLNDGLKNIYELNKELVSHPKGSVEYISTESRIRDSLQTLSSFFQLKQYKNSDGYMQIYTSNGYSLISTDMIYQTKYEPISSIEVMIDDGVFKPFYLTALDRNQQDVNLNIEITPQGKSSEVKHTLQNGSIAALLDIRDKDIPNALNQLDVLAKKLKDEFNIVHNSNNGFPPPSELAATHLMKRTDSLNFNGKFRLSIVDELGKPITNIPHPDLVIDLEKLDTGPNGPNLQGLMKEINYHFGEKLTTQNRASVANVSDIKLAAISSSVTANSSLVLDLELSNFSGNDAKVKILNATATDLDGNNILGSFNNANFNLATGNTLRTGTTGPSITINNGSTIKYPYTITIDVEVINADDPTPHQATITYLIDNPTADPFNGIKNQRFSPQSIAGEGDIYRPPLTTPLVTANLIDENSNIIANNNGITSGRLQLKTANSSYRIAIDQLDSKHVGDVSQNIFATGLSLTSYLGLNDVFVRNDAPSKWGNLKNTAIYLDVREDIKFDANNLAIAKLRTVPSVNIEGAKPTYLYEVTPGDSRAVIEFVDLANKPQSFPTVGKLPATSASFSSYAASIVSYSTSQTKLVMSQYEKSKLDTEALKDNLDSIKGVDINAELIKLGVYQQIFSASSRIIQFLNKFDEVMLSSFQ